MALVHSPRIVTDKLVFLVDAANPKSLSGPSATTWNSTGDSREIAYPNWGGPNSGTLDSGASYDSGNLGAIQFGSGDHVSFGEEFFDPGDDQSPDGSRSFSTTFWFKHDDTSDYMTLIGNDTTDDFCLLIYLFGKEKMRIASDGQSGIGNDNTFWTAPFVFDPNIWYNAVMIRDHDGSNYTFKQYVNGEFVGQSSALNDGPSSANVSNGSKTIGRSKNLGVSQSTMNFRGLISYVSAYQKVLSAEEVKQNYDALKYRYH